VRTTSSPTRPTPGSTPAAVAEARGRISVVEQASPARDRCLPAATGPPRAQPSHDESSRCAVRRPRLAARDRQRRRVAAEPLRHVRDRSGTSGRCADATPRGVRRERRASVARYVSAHGAARRPARSPRVRVAPRRRADLRGTP
jgi:hypothetical protein